jgi:AcrR family transcriptional regulator
VTKYSVKWLNERVVSSDRTASEELPVSAGTTVVPSRLERRKARTRAALIKAAQSFIAAGRLNVPVLEITQAADVGMGSFYNHFETKEELFAAAVEDVLDQHGALLDRLTEGIDDSAVVFAQSFRLTGRLHRREPELSKVLLQHGLQLISAETGLGPRARRDIEAATRVGRFKVADVDLALSIAAGSALALGQLLHEQPARDDAESADSVTEALLRTFGLTPREARRICSLPLPDSWTGSAADSTATS